MCHSRRVCSVLLERKQYFISCGEGAATVTNQQETYVIRKAIQLIDLAQIAQINKDVFAGSVHVHSAFEWIHTLCKARPIYQYYVITNTTDKQAVLGYAGWQVHGGWDRIEPVIELDQIGIAKSAQGKGLGEELIRSSLAELAPWLAHRSAGCKGIITAIVWGYTDNAPAMHLYGKIFTEGVCGKRIQFDNREENMYRLRITLKT